MKKELWKKIESGDRISEQEALALYDWDIHELAYLANVRRERIHPGLTTGFIFDRIINFTNVCKAKCSFCAFHSRAGSIPPYTLTNEEIIEKVDEVVSAGGTQVMLQGGLHDEFTLSRLKNMVSEIRSLYPDLYLHSFSPAEIVFTAQNENLSYEKVISELKASGLNSIPGASDLLIERMRNKVSPHKITVEQWKEVMTALKNLDMVSTATMTYGMGESIKERIEHLSVVRSVQDDTGILMAFIPWSFSPNNTEMNTVIPATGIDYLKIVAVSRIFLDNIKYIQAGWLTEGMKLAQVALTMGANDMGGVLTEEVVVRATGVETKTSVEEMIDIIHNAGREPVQRDSRYNILRRF